MKQLVLLPLVCAEFSVNSSIYDDIDRLYEKDKLNFHAVAKENEYYNHPLSKEGSLIQEVYFKKSLGILLNFDKYFDDVFSIMKKGWDYAYLYVNSNKQISLDAFVKAFLRKYKGIDNVDTFTLNSNILMAIEFSNILDRKIIDTEFYNYCLDRFNERLNHYDTSLGNRISLNFISKDEKKLLKDLKSALKERFGDFKNIIEPLPETLLNNYQEMITFIFDYEDFSLPNLVYETKITEKDIDEILYVWILYGDVDNLDDAGKFLLDMIILKYMIKGYKNAKEFYFKTNTNTLGLNPNSFESKIEDLNNELARKDLLIEILESSIKRAENDIKKLQKQLDDIKDNKEELVALRNLMFNLNPDTSINKKQDSTDKISSIKDLNCVVFGGTDGWQRKMKEILPNYKYVPFEAHNFDINILKSADYVIMNVTCLSHALYYKVVENIKGKKVVYLNNNNEDIVVNQIWDCFVNS